MSLNRMPMPSSPEKAPGSPSPETVETVYAGLQSKIGLVELQKEHPEWEIDTEHPENNTREIRNMAMMRLIETGKTKEIRAATDAAFGQDQLGTDPEALRAVLEKIGVTLH